MTRHDIINPFAEKMIQFGFKRQTWVEFERGNMIVRLENCTLPDYISVDDFPPFLKVKVYGRFGADYIEFTCEPDSIQFFKNEQG